MSNEIKVRIESSSPIADAVHLKTVKYDNLTSKPKINGVELVGNKTTADLGIEVDTSKFATKDDLAKVATVSISVVNALPETGEEKVLYFVPKDGEQPDVHDEYVWTNGAFELIGTTQVDLTGYVKNTDYATDVKAGVIKADSSFGTRINSNGYIYAYTESLTRYLNERDGNFIIGKGTLENIKKSLVERAVSEDGAVLSGYVKDTDYADVDGKKAGVIKTNSNYGLWCNTSGNLIIVKAAEDTILKKQHTYQPIVPKHLDYAVKVGVTTNTIALTDEEKAAAQAWLGIDTLVGDIESALAGV